MTRIARTGIDANSSIDALHTQIISSFSQADSTVVARRTGYFNHTYAPDLVLEWPSQKEERRVFVRTSNRAEYLAEDIQLAQDSDPIFVPVSGVEDPDRGTATRLQTVSRSGRVLVADSESIAALSSNNSEREISRIAARAVLQGGSGIIDEPEAAAFADIVAAGFDGALVGDSELTSVAVRQSLGLLDTRRHEQLSELLQAAWIGGGQTGASFPGTGSVVTALEPAALRLLLDTVEVEDEAFWKRLATGLQLHHLAGLTIADTHVGFQMLMRAAVQGLRAKAGRVSSYDAASLDDVRWAANDGRLILGVGKTRTEFVGYALSEFMDEGPEASPTLSEFVQRAQRTNTDVRKISLSTPNRRIDYVSEDGTSIASDDRLTALDSDIGGGASVLRASIDTSGRELGINYVGSTIAGNTRSLFHLSTLAMSGLPLLYDMREEELLALDEFFAVSEPDESQKDSQPEEQDL